MSETFRATLNGEVVRTSEANGRGTVEAIVSAFGVAYQMGTVKHRIQRAAFTDGLPHRLPIFWQHDWSSESPQPPIADASVTVARKGLRISAAFYLDSERGRSAYNAYKSGALTQWSIGYRVLDHDEADGGRTWDITSAELIEASAVLRGANPKTETLKVAAASNIPLDLDALERKLRPSSVSDAVADVRAAAARRERIASQFSPTSGSDAGLSLDDVAEAAAAQVERWSPEPQTYQLSYIATRAALAAQKHDTTGHAEFLAEPSHAPVPAGPLDLVTVTPHEEGHVKGANITRTNPATPTPFGSDAPSVGYLATGDAQYLGRVPVYVTADKEAVEDAGVGLPALLRAVADASRQGINGALTAADGTVENITGVLEAGVPTLDATALGETVALARAARTVHDAGFTGPLVLLGNPTVVDEVLLGSVRDEVPAVLGYVASPHIPAGTFVLGDWAAGAEVFVQPLRIGLTLSHADNFTKGRLTFAGETRLYAWWKQPAAFVHVTGVTG